MNVVPKLRTIFGFAFGGVMYKLLLVSDKEEIRSLYRRYAEWNTLGFEQPDVAENAQQGIDLLSHRRYDAISSLLSVSEGKKFFAYLSRRPEMLGMETARDEEHLRREISTARRALSTRDVSRQSKQVDDYTKVLQGEFFCDLLRGAAFDCTKIDERMQSLKLDALDAARWSPLPSGCRRAIIFSPRFGVTAATGWKTRSKTSSKTAIRRWRSCC